MSKKLGSSWITANDKTASVIKWLAQAVKDAGGDIDDLSCLSDRKGQWRVRERMGAIIALIARFSVFWQEGSYVLLEVNRSTRLIWFLEALNKVNLGASARLAIGLEEFNALEDEWEAGKGGSCRPPRPIWFWDGSGGQFLATCTHEPTGPEVGGATPVRPVRSLQPVTDGQMGPSVLVLVRKGPVTDLFTRPSSWEDGY